MLDAHASPGSFGFIFFTFMQAMPKTSPKYAYPMEWDNLAVIPVSTFHHSWRNHQIRSFPRNRARQAAKEGVAFR